MGFTGMAKRSRPNSIGKQYADKYQRMTGDIVRFSSDSIIHSFNRMNSIIVEGMSISRQEHDRVLSETASLAVLADAWNIVDRFDTIYKVYRDPAITIENLENPESLASLGWTASILRNRMDHLTQNLLNLVKQRVVKVNL